MSHDERNSGETRDMLTVNPATAVCGRSCFAISLRASGFI